MRISGTVGKRLGIGLAAAAALAAVLVGVAVYVVVPRVIVAQLQGRVGGKAEVGGWWVDGRSAGLTGLKLHEGPGADSPVWLSTPRVSTDLTLGGLLRGRFAPRRVRVDAPVIAVRIGPGGEILTHPGGKSGKASPTGPVPVVIAERATVHLEQEGRPAMVVRNVTARLGPDGDSARLAVRSNDPEWGPFEAHGAFGPGFTSGRLELKSTGAVTVTPAKVAAIPFVPPAVWANVAPQGDVDIRLDVELGGDAAAPVRVRTEIGLRGTSVKSTALDLTAAGGTGRVVVVGPVVRIETVSGRAIDGRVTANGTLDFGVNPPRFDVGLDLKGINVADAPPSWQLHEAGVTGHLTGRVNLVALLDPKGVDLSGTTGEAVVEGGVIQGIPFKSLKLVMDARGGDLRYDTAGARASMRPGPVPMGGLVAGLVALQAPKTEAAPGSAKDATKDAPNQAPKRPAIQLPKSLTTQLELEDVDVAQLVAKAQFMMGFPFPLPVTGRLTMKAEATIPLGQLKGIKGYAFHGDVTLKKASVYKVDLGRISARLDLADGVLDLSDLRGHLVDHPDGGPDNPPRADPVEVPKTGPLPPGAFRGHLKAAISPPGRLSAHFEGNDLPMGELAAPALPRPTPLSGLATLAVDASADLSAASDPAGWDVSGTARSRQIRYQGADLDAFAVRFALKKGRLDVPELSARLKGRPFSASGGVDLKAPHAFSAQADVAGWNLAEVLEWVPAAPKPAPVSGSVTARAGASGTLQPFAMTTEGRGRFERLVAGPVALGEVPFGWATRGQAVEVTVADARPFGGHVSAHATVPLVAGRAVQGAATVKDLDTARLSAAIPGGSLQMTGKASGTIRFTVPSDVSSLEAAVALTAPDLTVQGIPADQARVAVRAHKGSLGYEVTADSLGGKITLKGAFPLSAAPAKREADGELRAIGFSLGDALRSLGMTGVVARLGGLGAVDANVRAVSGGRDAGVYAHGVAEFREIRWGPSAVLGHLRGVVAMTPTVWRVDPLGGVLLGGDVSGFLWGTSPTAGPGAAPAAPGAGRGFGFDVRVDRVSLRSVLAVVNLHGLPVEGAAMLRVAGTLGETFRGTGEIRVARARVAGLPLTDLRMPAELASHGGNSSGAVHVRRWSARLAGGQVHGDGWFRFGDDRAFQADVVLANVDLESISRIESEARRPASGKISGRITLSGPNPALPRRYRGKVSFDLDDASVVSLPVFRQLDRFLGAAQGGLFEDGDLVGTIANGQINVEMLTLVGRLAQVHATGTVGFDGQLALEVLVNTNQIIAQSGQALVGAIPGLNSVLGRSTEALARVSSFLSNRLLKFRVTGTVQNPSVALDPGVGVNDNATSFFVGVLKLPIGQGR